MSRVGICPPLRLPALLKEVAGKSAVGCVLSRQSVDAREEEGVCAGALPDRGGVSIGAGPEWGGAFQGQGNERTPAHLPRNAPAHSLRDTNHLAGSERSAHGVAPQSTPTKWNAAPSATRTAGMPTTVTTLTTIVPRIVGRAAVTGRPRLGPVQKRPRGAGGGKPPSFPRL
jgi:hypothetical protein